MEPSVKKSPKKRKRQSAFRIKTGSLVALRYQSEGNDLYDEEGNSLRVKPENTAIVESWVDPTPGIDEGLALIGRRIRCCFPKSVLSEESVTSRIVEGTIVGLVDFDREKWNQIRQVRSERGHAMLMVELLVAEKDVLPFLERVDTHIDVSKLSQSEMKRHRYEEIIRGKNMVVVRTQLTASSKSVATSSSSAAATDSGEVQSLCCKWVLRKRIVVSGNFKNVSDRPKILSKYYAGNKYDSEAQQEANWRWLARRKRPVNDIDCAITGNVISVLPDQDKKTLAMVTLQQLRLPEHVGDVRLNVHQPWDLFRDNQPRIFKVPVEQVVIVSRKVAQLGSSNGDGNAVVKYSYSPDSGSHAPLNGFATGESSLSSDTKPLVCHRCGVEGTEMLKDHIAITPSAISCHECLSKSKQFGKSGTFLKSCRCKTCNVEHATILNRAFHVSLLRGSGNVESQSNDPICATCCLRCRSGVSCRKCQGIMHKRCAKWGRFIDAQHVRETFDVCTSCQLLNGNGTLTEGHLFSEAARIISNSRCTDFDLPPAFLNLEETQLSSAKPITAAKPRGPKGMYSPRGKTTKTPTPASRKRQRPEHSAGDGVGSNDTKTKKGQKAKGGSQQEIPKFDGCSFLLPYDPIKRRFDGISKHHLRSDPRLSAPDVVRNVRSLGSAKVEEKKTASRANRANQRRMMKDVRGLGSASLELDALSGRESSLRFERSSIHAWGVLADQPIREGELVVEYRGEIIGNAVAEKREKEYELAKIGSDYMFRIDKEYVCDATKQGNVARFINASCDPNCYTQIISISGTKRIVIYAKKDIPVGQELCYDYKFPLEYDEEKRITCHCGTKICRGFMNWDKKYVGWSLAGIPPTEPQNSEVQELSPQCHVSKTPK